MNDHQIQRFEARDLFFNILSSLYIQNWLCVKELIKPAYLKCFMGGGMLHPPWHCLAALINLYWHSKNVAADFPFNFRNFDALINFLRRTLNDGLELTEKAKDLKL